MASPTNRTERLVKALKDSRPDFTLHNARVFARAVIEAPDGAFGEKPLSYLPREPRGTDGDGSTKSELLRGLWPHDDVSDVWANSGDGPHAALCGLGGSGKSFSVVTYVAPGAEFFRLDSAASRKPVPVSPAAAQTGDLVVQPSGVSGLYLGSGRVFVAGYGTENEGAGSRNSAGQVNPTSGAMHAAGALEASSPGVGTASRPRAWNRLAHEVVRPLLPANGTLRQAMDTWYDTEFVLGVDANGSDATWNPARSGGLAVIGRIGSGKSAVADSLLDQARARGWMTLHATSKSDGSPDPKETPGLVMSGTPYPPLSDASSNGFNSVIAMASLIVRKRLNERAIGRFKRMSRVPWNFGGGPVSIRLRSPDHCARRVRHVRQLRVRGLLAVSAGAGGRSPGGTACRPRPSRRRTSAAPSARPASV